MGLQAASPPVVVGPKTISARLASDGSFWINQSAVKLDDLRGFFLNVFWLSACIVLFSSKVTVLSSLERLPTLRSSGAPPLASRLPNWKKTAERDGMAPTGQI